MHLPRTTFLTLCVLITSQLSFASPVGDIDAAGKLDLPHNDVSDSYIITLRNHVDLGAHLSMVQDLHARSQVKRDDGKEYAGVFHRYDEIPGFQGYAGHFQESVVEQLRNHEHVEAVELDQLVTSALSTQAKTNSSGIYERSAPEMAIQGNAPWNLVQISHRDLKTQGTYVYDKGQGHGTFAYVIDTGILPTHDEFNNRPNRVRNGINVVKSEPWWDLNGHGTHVAGIVGGKTYGVAKDCALISVKVMGQDGIGKLSNSLKGYGWAAKAIYGSGMQGSSVINMSFSGGLFPLCVTRAISKAAKKGVTTVLCAGNSGEDIYLPVNAITVGATNSQHERAKFSNFGKKVTLFAPGVQIKSAWIHPGKAGTRVTSGTSMAAPHVAGVVLMLKSRQTLKTADATKKALIDLAIKDAVHNGESGSNLFLYNGSGQ